MREAQKLMNDPQFQAQMKKMTESEGFKQHMKKSQDTLKDPKKLKELEEKMAKQLEEGNEQLKKYEAAEAEFLAKQKAKKENGEEEGEEDGDKKEAAEEEVDDMPDIPSLNLN